MCVGGVEGGKENSDRKKKRAGGLTEADTELNKTFRPEKERVLLLYSKGRNLIHETTIIKMRLMHFS